MIPLTGKSKREELITQNKIEREYVKEGMKQRREDELHDIKVQKAKAELDALYEKMALERKQIEGKLAIEQDKLNLDREKEKTMMDLDIWDRQQQSQRDDHAHKIQMSRDEDDHLLKMHGKAADMHIQNQIKAKSAAMPGKDGKPGKPITDIEMREIPEIPGFEMGTRSIPRLPTSVFNPGNAGYQSGTTEIKPRVDSSGNPIKNNYVLAETKPPQQNSLNNAKSPQQRWEENQAAKGRRGYEAGGIVSESNGIGVPVNTMQGDGRMPSGITNWGAAHGGIAGYQSGSGRVGPSGEAQMAYLNSLPPSVRQLMIGSLNPRDLASYKAAVAKQEASMAAPVAAPTATTQTSAPLQQPSETVGYSVNVPVMTSDDRNTRLMFQSRGSAGSGGGNYSGFEVQHRFNHGGNVPTNPEAGPSDTVPAMLTPGEAVIPREAAQHPDNKPIIAAMIDQGREMQKFGQGTYEVPGYSIGAHYVDGYQMGVADLPAPGVDDQQAFVTGAPLGPVQTNQSAAETQRLAAPVAAPVIKGATFNAADQKINADNQAKLSVNMPNPNVDNKQPFTTGAPLGPVKYDQSAAETQRLANHKPTDLNERAAFVSPSQRGRKATVSDIAPVALNPEYTGLQSQLRELQSAQGRLRPPGLANSTPEAVAQYEQQKAALQGQIDETKAKLGGTQRLASPTAPAGAASPQATAAAQAASPQATSSTVPPVRSAAPAGQRTGGTPRAVPKIATGISGSPDISAGPDPLDARVAEEEAGMAHIGSIPKPEGTEEERLNARIAEEEAGMAQMTPEGRLNARVEAEEAAAAGVTPENADQVKATTAAVTDAVKASGAKTPEEMQKVAGEYLSKVGDFFGLDDKAIKQFIGMAAVSKLMGASTMGAVSHAFKTASAGAAHREQRAFEQTKLNAAETKANAAAAAKEAKEDLARGATEYKDAFKQERERLIKDEYLSPGEANAQAAAYARNLTGRDITGRPIGAAKAQPAGSTGTTEGQPTGSTGQVEGTPARGPRMREGTYLGKSLVGPFAHAPSKPGNDVIITDPKTGGTKQVPTHVVKVNGVDIPFVNIPVEGGYRQMPLQEFKQLQLDNKLGVHEMSQADTVQARQEAERQKARQRQQDALALESNARARAAEGRAKETHAQSMTAGQRANQDAAVKSISANLPEFYPGTTDKNKGDPKQKVPREKIANSALLFANSIGADPNSPEFKRLVEQSAHIFTNTPGMADKFSAEAMRKTMTAQLVSGFPSGGHLVKPPENADPIKAAQVQVQFGAVIDSAVSSGKAKTAGQAFEGIRDAYNALPDKQKKDFERKARDGGNGFLEFALTLK